MDPILLHFLIMLGQSQWEKRYASVFFSFHEIPARPVITLGLLASNMPVDRLMRRASCCLERRGETEREREAREEDDSSMED